MASCRPSGRASAKELLCKQSIEPWHKQMPLLEALEMSHVDIRAWTGG